jgi:hypothetical protein
MFKCPDDGVQNFGIRYEHCNFSPPSDKSLFPCNRCLQVGYCEKQCAAADCKFHSQECEPDIN